MSYRKSLLPSIEPLEARIAPASLVNGVLKYMDTNGDMVQVAFSKNIFSTSAQGIIDSVFTFSTGSVDKTTNAAQELNEIDLSKLISPAIASGVSITVSITEPGGSSTGLVNIETINAPGINLGKIIIPGDLWQINAGSISLLQVHSIGATASSSATSAITGSIGNLNVAGNIQNALIAVTGSISSLEFNDLIGGSTAGSGEITFGTIGKAAIGDLVGGSAANTGALSGATIGTLIVSGDLAGAGGNGSGQIYFTKSASSITIDGNILGGAGTYSGSIEGLISGSSTSALGPVTVLGALQGGGGDNSGSISATSINSVSIAGAVTGGAGDYSGGILFTSKLGKTVIGELTGGGGQYSGSVLGNNGDPLASYGSTLSSLAVLQSAAANTDGSIEGGSGVGSGQVQADNITSVTVTGDVVAGAASETGVIQALTLGTVKIAGNLDGSSATDSDSAEIFGGFSIKSVTVTNVLGGSAVDTGMIRSGTDLSSGGVIGSVTVSGALTGGTADSTGEILATTLSKISLGSIKGGSADGANVAASADSPDASTDGGVVGDSIGTVTIAGSITGGGGLGSGAILGGTINSILMKGDLNGGSGDSSGLISFATSLGKLSIGVAGKTPTGGSIIGGSGSESGQILGFAGSTLGTLTMTGALEGNSSTAEETGNIQVNNVGTLDIGSSSASANTAAIEGGGGTNSGFIYSAGLIKTLDISGSVIGGSGSGSADIHAQNLGAIKISGNVTTAVADTAFILADQDIGSVSILGNLAGTGTGDPGIFAGGQSAVNPNLTADVAIKTVTIGGNIVDATIAAGFNPSAYNADAQIGSVAVKGELINSSILAGAELSGNTYVKISGTSTVDLPSLVSKIGSVTIGSSTDLAGDIASESFGMIKIAGENISLASLTPGSSITPVPDIGIYEVL